MKIAGTTILVLAGAIAFIGLLLIPLPGPGILLIAAAAVIGLAEWFLTYLSRP